MYGSQLAHFIAPKSIKKKNERCSFLSFLVDPEGVEPSSENPLIPLSPGAVSLLNLVLRYAE